MDLLDVVVWAGFLVFVLTLLALDLGVFHRETRAIRSGEALAWAAFYVSLALAFNGLVYLLYENNWLGVGESVGHPLGGIHPATGGVNVEDHQPGTLFRRGGDHARHVRRESHLDGAAHPGPIDRGRLGSTGGRQRQRQGHGRAQRTSGHGNLPEVRHTAEV